MEWMDPNTKQHFYAELNTILCMDKEKVHQSKPKYYYQCKYNAIVIAQLQNTATLRCNWTKVPP